MDLIMLVLMLALVGLAVWLITTKIPMDPMFRLAIQVIVLIVMIFYVLRTLGVNVPNVMP